MSKLLSKSWFRCISLILIHAFLMLDVAWAGGTELNLQKNSDTLAAHVEISQQMFNASFGKLYEMNISKAVVQKTAKQKLSKTLRNSKVKLNKFADQAINTLLAGFKKVAGSKYFWAGLIGLSVFVNGGVVVGTFLCYGITLIVFFNIVTFTAPSLNKSSKLSRSLLGIFMSLFITLNTLPGSQKKWSNNIYIPSVEASNFYTAEDVEFSEELKEIVEKKFQRITAYPYSVIHYDDADYFITLGPAIIPIMEELLSKIRSGEYTDSDIFDDKREILILHCIGRLRDRQIILKKDIDGMKKMVENLNFIIIHYSAIGYESSKCFDIFDAVKALGETGKKDIGEFLFNIYKDIMQDWNPSGSHAFYKDSLVRPFLRAFYNTKNIDGLLFIAESEYDMGKLAEQYLEKLGNFVVNPLIDLLKNRSADGYLDKEIVAARLLGRIGDNKATKVLREILQDEELKTEFKYDPGVLLSLRKEVIESLRLLEGEKIVPLLIEEYLNFYIIYNIDVCKNERERILNILKSFEIKTINSIKETIEKYGEYGIHYLRNNRLKELVKGMGIKEELFEYYYNEFIYGNYNAVDGLVFLGDKRAFLPMLNSLNNLDGEAQVKIIRGLPYFKDDRIIVPFITLYKKNDNLFVKLEILESFGVLADSDTLSFLHEVANESLLDGSVPGMIIDYFKGKDKVNLELKARSVLKIIKEKRGGIEAYSILVPFLFSPVLIALTSKLSWAGDGNEVVSWFEKYGVAGLGAAIVLIGFFNLLSQVFKKRAKSKKASNQKKETEVKCEVDKKMDASFYKTEITGYEAIFPPEEDRSGDGADVKSWQTEQVLDTDLVIQEVKESLNCDDPEEAMALILKLLFGPEVEPIEYVSDYRVYDKQGEFIGYMVDGKVYDKYRQELEGGYNPLKHELRSFGETLYDNAGKEIALDPTLQKKIEQLQQQATDFFFKGEVDRVIETIKEIIKVYPNSFEVMHLMMDGVREHEKMTLRKPKAKAFINKKGTVVELTGDAMSLKEAVKAVEVNKRVGQLVLQAI